MLFTIRMIPIASFLVLSLIHFGLASSPYPGKVFEMPKTGWRVYIPDGLKAVRAATIAFEEREHDETHMAAIMGFACYWVGKKEGGGFVGVDKHLTRERVQAYFDEAATITGHPELAWAPIISYGNSRNSGKPRILANILPERTIAIHCGLQGAEGVGFKGLYDKSVPTISSEEEDVGGRYGMIEKLPSIHAKDRAAGYSITTLPMWGWGHGFYSVGDFYWIWLQNLVNMRLPRNWDPLKGPPKLLPVPEGWHGDTDSWRTLWPTIKKGKGNDKSAWLPNEETAWAWRAYVSSHPTETQKDQGMMHAGDAATNYLMRGQANFKIMSPSEPYNLKSRTGRNYPVAKQGTHIRVQARDWGKAKYDYREMDRVELFDGSKLVAQSPPKFTGIYTFTVALEKIGTRFLTAQVVFKNGTRVTTRPALLHVHSADTFLENFRIVPMSTSIYQAGRKRSHLELRISQELGAFTLSGRRVSASQSMGSGLHLVPIPLNAPLATHDAETETKVDLLGSFR